MACPLQYPIANVDDGNPIPWLPAVFDTPKGGHMKKHAITLVGVLSLLMAAGSAFAQTLHVKGDIPFSFIVNKETLPAGQYDFKSLGLSDGKIILVRNADGKAMTTVNNMRAESKDTCQQTKLVFTRYGTRYFLHQIWVAGDNAGQQLPKSPRENEVAMDYTPSTVVVLAQLK
jgi:hypothetical protein